MILILYENNKFNKEIEYVFNYICKYIYRLDDNFCIDIYKDASLNNIDLIISYGKEKYNNNFDVPQIHIFESDLFGEEYLKKSSMPPLPLKRYTGSEVQSVIDEKDLPAIYSGNGNLNKLVEIKENLIETNIDIIASSFFMITRYEEVVNPVKDEHDRFPAQASLAYKEGFLDRPIVNEYIELLWNWIKKLYPIVERSSIWGEKDFAFFLSHDIDHIYKYGSGLKKALNGIKKIGGAIIKRGDLKEAILNIKELRKKDPYFIFEDMMEIEEKYNIKSSWYFKVDNNTPGDGDKYFLNELDSIIEQLTDKGHEIGIHPSYNSYNSEQAMKEEVNKLCNRYELKNKSFGGRQHYLRFNVKKTWSIQEKCGLLYDSTLGYADVVGFRAGICHPYKPYDFEKRRAYDLWEIPLIVMDGTLKQYMELTPQQANEELTKLIKQVEKYQGIFSLLWHNTSLDSLWNDWNDLYKDILRTMKKRNLALNNGLNLILQFENKNIYSSIFR
ncbi:polysaccharide deacetylase family protein [Natroniella sp. ANB-PHB2]|uniref:polysaccharide deacetylase family protein n=1 Tax=Natroniella sp. ANB-PHB2 TaxID=3384444 RepID=UPI0038D3B24E